MPRELRDGLSPQQTEALDAAAINGGRVVTDRDLYEALDGQAVREPEAFAAVDLAQHRLSLGDRDYERLVGFQKAIVEGRSDAAFERHGLGRVFLDEGLHEADIDPDGPEGRTARQRLDRLLGAFEAVEGRPPTMADIRGLVGDVVRRSADDPNIVRVNAPGVTEAVDNGQGAQQQEVVEGRLEGESATVPAQSEGALRPDESVVQSDGQGRTVDGEGDSQRGEGDIQVVQVPSYEPGGKGPSTPKQAPGGGQKPPANKPATGAGKKEVNKRTAAQIAQDAKTRQDKTWPEAIQAPVPKLQPKDQQPLPDDWEGAVNRINPDYLKWTKAAAEKHGIPPELLARLINKESTYDNKQVSNMGANLMCMTSLDRKAEILGDTTLDRFPMERGLCTVPSYSRSGAGG